jgi:hypothetical protein
VAGSYIVFYWVTVLAPQDDGRAGGALITGVEDVSSRLTTAIGARPLLSGVVFLATVIAAAWYARRSRSPDGEPGRS